MLLHKYYTIETFPLPTKVSLVITYGQNIEVNKLLCRIIPIATLIRSHDVRTHVWPLNSRSLSVYVTLVHAIVTAFIRS